MTDSEHNTWLTSCSVNRLAVYLLGLYDMKISKCRLIVKYYSKDRSTFFFVKCYTFSHFHRILKFKNSPQNCSLFALSSSSYNQYVKCFTSFSSKDHMICLFFPTSIHFRVLPRVYETETRQFTLILLIPQFWIYRKYHWLENA